MIAEAPVDNATPQTTPWNDLRDWMENVDALGQLARVNDVDPHLEVGALAELVFRQTKKRPALLLDEMKGYAPGHRLLLNPVGSPSRLALTFNLPQGLTDLQMVDALRQRISNLQPIPAVTVGDGPIFENVKTGADIDLNEFPAPFWHERDGGRYIGTGDLVITRDPDERWVNSGTYRIMIHDRDTAGIYINPNGHGAVHMQKYFDRGEPCPVVISVGPDPLLFSVGCTNIPRGISELDYAGAIRGRPVEVVTGPITGLPIPARSEIVLEGEILPELRAEGPFGEFAGYYASGTQMNPIVKIKAIYHRNNPIVVGVPPLRPPSDNTFVNLYVRPALIWNALEAAGIPDIKGVFGLGGVSVFFIAVAIKQRYAGHAKQVGLLVSQLPPGVHMNRFVVVVDDDIDVTDPEAVIWAMSTRCDPETHVDLIRRCVSSPLDPALELTRENSQNSRMVIDACRPFERLKDYPPVVECSPEMKAHVENRFADLLAQW